MSTITDKVRQINSGIASVKSAFKSALIDKGVSVTDQKLKDYPALVESIKGINADLSNLTANNVKSGVTINGVTGTFTNDANAIGSAIKEGYTAYVNGQKIYGELANVGLYQDGYLTVAISNGWTFGGSLTLTDSNLIADNIKKDVTIFGVTGTYEGDALNIVVSDTEPVNPVEGMIWIDTSVADDEGGSSGGETTSKHTLILSGFSAANGSDIYGVDVNGEYVLDDETKTGYDRTWTCSTNGCQVIYRGDWGYWGISSPTNASGGDTYTYGVDGNPYNADGSSTQWQCRGAEIDATAVVKGNSDSGSGDSGSTEINYLYTVSGCSTESANGHYYETGETFNGAKSYTNGSCYIFFDSGSMWYLSTHKHNTTNAPIATCSNSDSSQVPTSGWSDGVTVSVYGGGAETSNKIIVSNASQTEVNGVYAPYAGSSMLAYKHETNEMYLWLNTNNNNYWTFTAMKPDEAVNEMGMWLYGATDNGSQSPIGLTYNAMGGARPNMPIVEAYAGGGESGGGTSTADYIVSGAGTEAVNGNYYATGNYINGNQGAIYKHETNEVYLFANGSNCFLAFEAVYSPAYYYNCETYSYDIQTGNWETDALYPSLGSGSTPYPTVTKG